MVEGKSYPDEMLKGSPTASGPGSSNRHLIDSSLAWTRGKLGAPEDYADDWSGALYQNANRLAHLLWLREHGVDAWLVHLLFVGDKTTRPTTEPQWKTPQRRLIGASGCLLPPSRSLGIFCCRLDRAKTSSCDAPGAIATRCYAFV